MSDAQFVSGTPRVILGALVRNLVPWLLAVLTTSVLGSLVQTHVNLVNLLEMGAYWTLEDWQRSMVHDLLTFMPFFALLVGVAFLLAFPVALWISKEKWPDHRAGLLALAGAVSLAVAFFVADTAAPIPTLIAATRDVTGYVAMLACGAVGGWVFHRASATEELRSRPGVSLAYLSVPVLVLGGAFGLHVAMKPERSLEIEDVPMDGFEVAVLVDGLVHPFSMARLPDGRWLIVERVGRLRIVDRDGALLREPVAGVPEVIPGKQAGLLDIELSPDFERDRLVFLSYACGTAEENHTCIGRGTFNDDRLDNFERIFQGRPLKATGVQFGSRILFLPDGTLLASVGDGFDLREDAQDLGSHIGKLVRLNPDGSVPDDNPFIGRDDVLPEIYSYGHRNPQGLVRDERTGAIYESEHGPYGGDEVNRIEPGVNYGWPLATEGVNYPGSSISPHDDLDEVRGPLNHWTPSIAPSGIALYRGDAFPELDGDLLVSGLAGKGLFHLELEDGRVTSDRRLFHALDKRIRDVMVGDDGELYLLTDHDPGQLLRIDPAEPDRPD
ncbi:PQQ-dependent sugar dehydrogenase [Halomonas denitrificans]|nr:PQQ-dependent sugar dehydrogenase [Halomonas denitrificans]